MDDIEITAAEKKMADESNVFRNLLEAMWSRGEDGEVLARELAAALVHAVFTGVGAEKADAEIVKLMVEAKKNYVG